MLPRSGKLLALCLALAGLALAQGLNTPASKDDWEEINFEFDSDILTDGFPSMLRLAELLNKHPDYRVKLVGHADYIGPDRYNEKLGLRRANAVKRFLEKYGARPGQITVETRGESSPKVPARTDEARFMNRRVEITVTDAQGRVVSAGGVGEAIGALEKLLKKQEECCNTILKKLDKLDEILAALNDLKQQNARLQSEIDALKAKHGALQKEVAEIPRPPAPSKEQLAKVAEEAARKARAPKFEHFSILGLNVGTDDRGDVTWTGKGRYFRPFWERLAVQAEGEFLGWKGRKEGQFDIGLVGRYEALQLGVFGSFKHVTLSDYDRGGTLGQASLTADYIFGRGRIGLFGSKGFLDKALIQTRSIGATGNVIENTFLRTVDQIGASGAVGLWGTSWIEGNLGFLKGRQVGNKAGGTARIVLPFKEHWAFTVEGGVNETLLARDTYGRWAVGIRYGNFLSPKHYADVGHPVPADIPRVRWEVVTERIRNGNAAPIADAGADLIGVAAGQIRLDGSASSDPDGDPITFQWTQISGPPVTINGADTAVATFVAEEGQVYAFRLTVTDELGASASDSVSVTTKEAPRVRILQFTATPNQINRGGSAKLNWQVENADEVAIDNGVGSVNSQSGTVTVTPQETTIYTLTARNAVSEVTQTVIVVVETPIPAFIRCDVTPQNITQGESAVINWQAENADQVSLSGFGTVPVAGSQTVSPMENTTYTLTAVNANGTVSCPLVVQVTRGEVPRILRFTANPVEILQGDAAALFWQVENADEVTIDNGVGSVNPNAGSVNVTPTDTTAYTLRAKNRFGEVQANVVVKVVKPAKVVNFSASPNPVPQAGGLVTLSWATENADEVVISGLGKRPASGSIPLRITEETTFTIVARNRFSQDSASVTITIAPPPEKPTSEPPVANAGADFETTSRIIHLDGTASSDPEGRPLTYQWRVIQGTASIVNPNSPTPEVTLGGQAGIYVFELTVIDDTGNQATDTVTVNFINTTMF